MNLYEQAIVARQDTSPSQIKQLTEKYSKIVEKNDGEIVKTEEWGLLNLSYLIKKNRKTKNNPIQIYTSSIIQNVRKYINDTRSPSEYTIALYKKKKFWIVKRNATNNG